MHSVETHDIDGRVGMPFLRSFPSSSSSDKFFSDVVYLLGVSSEEANDESGRHENKT